MRTGSDGSAAAIRKGRRRFNILPPSYFFLPAGHLLFCRAVSKCESVAGRPAPAGGAPALRSQLAVIREGVSPPHERTGPLRNLP